MAPRWRAVSGAGVLLGGLLALGAFGCRGEAPPAAAGAPGTSAPPQGVSLAGADVLLVTLDTLRADALGFAGRADVRTPTLDRLAASGRTLANAHAHNVTTLASHTNMLTGLYPYQHGVRENAGFVLGDDHPTLATALREAGYATAAIIGAFPLDARFGLNRGFDLYDDQMPPVPGRVQMRFAERRGDAVVAAARQWWQNQPGKKFLWAHLYDPHAPYQPAAEHAARHPTQPYYGEVEATDAYLAPLLVPFLEGRERPALVIVTADHGEALGDHGEVTHGLFAYEPTLAVPLLVWHPGITPGVDQRSAAHVDILPTVLAALGLPVPEGLPGRSLLAPEEPGRQIYFEALSTFFNRGWAPLRGLIADGHKMIALPIPELYDLAADPGETRNLFRDERRRYQTLAAALPSTPEWPPGQRRIDTEEAARLRSLGYVAATPSTKHRFGPEDDPKNLLDLDRMVHEAIAAEGEGRLDEALRIAVELTRRRTDMPIGYETAAKILRDQGHNAEAIAVMEKAIANGAADSSLMRQLGLTLAEVGRPQEAVAILEPLAADLADLDAVNGLAVALSDAGRHREAIAQLERVFSVVPEETKALETMGVVQLRLERPVEAQRFLERALARDPRRPLSWNTLGVSHAVQGNYPAAMEAWDRALALDPRLFDALYNLGLTAANAGDRTRARESLGRYVATAPPDRYGAEIRRAQQILGSLR